MTPVVVAEHLTKHYGRRLGVHDVSFEAGAGEVLGLLGPNGSGKTTILRILTGYLHATAGRASVAGFDVVRQGLEARRRLGYVPEEVPLYPQMHVAEFLAFMGRLKGLDGAPLRDALELNCARLSLDGVREVTIGKLSRGYRQRVMIAQALLNDPALLILDEPTNGLDPHQIIEVRELIRSLSARHTIIVTSHILSEIERIATRVAILLNGRLLAMQSLERGARPKFRLRVRGHPPERVRTTLRAVSGVTSVNASSPVLARPPDENASSAGRDSSTHLNNWVVEVEQPCVAEALAAAVAAGGFGLLEMTETRTDLEHLFLNLTRQAAA